MVELARERGIDLVVIGPEAPLVAGVGDALRAAGFAVFGPNAAAAQLEGSKGFTKDLCARQRHSDRRLCPRRHGRRRRMTRSSRFGIPVVIKADGLAAGKGVTVAMSRDEAEAAIDAAGDGPMVIEEFLEGEEASLFALVDGETRDPARLGAGSQARRRRRYRAEHRRNGRLQPGAGPDARARAAGDGRDRPADGAGHGRGRNPVFSGVLYAGLMLTAEGPKLIEYNVRFGDPECEAIMPRIEGDFAELLHAVATGRLGELRAAELSPHHAMTVIVAARGYPGTPASGGADPAKSKRPSRCRASPFSTPARRDRDDSLVAKGGRVLAVTAVAETFANARARAYRAVDQIDFADGFHRRDIGWRELERSGEGAMADQ